MTREELAHLAELGVATLYEAANREGLIDVPLEIQQDAARRVMAVLKETFGSRFDSGDLSLSVDIREMREGVALTSHNIPDGGKPP